MTKCGFARGSLQSRRDGRRGRRWAQLVALLSLCACSGATDVVGVLPAEVEANALEGPESANEGSTLDGVSDVTGGEGVAPDQFLIVAGMREPSWDGPALAWPFSVSLRDFFEDSSWPGGSGPPPRVERQVIAVMGSKARPENVRFVAPSPHIAERLRDVFAEAEAELDGAMVARVMRDRRSEEYRVALGPASCGYAPGHHGRPCAEAPADGFEHP